MLNDLRFAFRQLAKSPGFAAIALVTFALGLGATTAVFSVVHGVLLQPPDFPHPEQLVRLTEYSTEEPSSALSGPVALPTFLDWQKASSSYQALAARQNASFVLTGENETLRLIGATVTGDYWRVFGTAPLLGRTFSADDTQSDVVVLSHGLWQNQFGGATDIVGRTIQLGTKTVTVLGVMPPEFEMGGAALWRPMEIRADSVTAENRGAHGLQVFGRLRSGVTVVQANKELELIEGQLVRQFPSEMRNYTAAVNPLLESVVAPQRPVLLTFALAVGGLLVIACINITNLLLAQAASRAKEISLRAVLGASPARILRQLLIESLLLAALGGLFGLLFAWGGLKLLVAFAPPGLPRLENIGLSAPVLMAATGIMMACGLAVGLAPGLLAARLNLLEALKCGGIVGEGHRRDWMRRGLIVAETALGFIILVNSGLMMRSFVRLAGVNPGFNPNQAVTVVVAMAGPHYQVPAQRQILVHTLTERFRAIPGVTDVGAASTMPFSGSSLTTTARIQGREFEANDPHYPSAAYFTVTPDYFSAMGIPVTRGRCFTDSDGATAPRVAIISRSFAAQYFPGVDPIGQHISMSVQQGVVWREVVGVVGDIKSTSLDASPSAQMYEPYAQSPSGFVGVVVRTKGTVPGLAASLRRELRAVDKSLPIVRIDPLDNLIAATYARQRFAAWLLAIFAATSLLLAANGLYGVMAYSVRQRTAEFGLRAALGALPQDLMILVLRRGAVLVATGLLLGLSGALGLSRLVESYLFGTNARDPLAYAVLAFFFVGVATLACWVPARRAAKVDPMVALRSE